ncbi:MAG: UDP-3-O-(3-hydroxymyristoyl)glucosamine N-acyltransferase [Bdellovibrionia bacterium]
MGLTAQEILERTGGAVVNLEALRLAQVPWQGRDILKPASLGISKSSDLAFFFSKAFEEELKTANPGVLVIGEAFAQPLEQAKLPFWNHTVVIACKNPYLILAQLSEVFAEGLSTVAHAVGSSDELQGQAPEVHPTAVVAPSVQLGRGVRIQAHCVVEEGCELGEGVQLYPGCYLGPGCKVGRFSVLFPRVTLYEWTQIGERVRIHAGSVLGSDGFGYVPKRESGQMRGHQKIYHLGQVVVEDDVEIGANSCIDRGTFGETRIGRSSKLDNLVHVGHNSTLEQGAVICGGTCLAGHASIGKFATIGGLTGIGNHVHVGEGSQVGALSMITKDVPPGETVVGNPQRTYKEHFRAHALLSQLVLQRRAK